MNNQAKNSTNSYISTSTSGFYGIVLPPPPAFAVPAMDTSKARLAATRRANLEAAREKLATLRANGVVIHRSEVKPGALAKARSEAYAAEMAARKARVKGRDDAAFAAEAKALAEASSREATLLEGRATELRHIAESIRERKAARG